MGRGRKTKLTPELQEKLVQYILADNYFETACWGVGITPQTGYNWLNRGERESKGIYRAFYLAIKKAEAEAEIVDIAYIKAGKDSWQSRAWIRERRSRERWGRTQIEITGKDGGPIYIADAKARLLSKLSRISGIAAGQKEKDANAESDPERS